MPLSKSDDFLLRDVLVGYYNYYFMISIAINWFLDAIINTFYMRECKTNFLLKTNESSYFEITNYESEINRWRRYFNIHVQLMLTIVKIKLFFWRSGFNCQGHEKVVLKICYQLYPFWFFDFTFVFTSTVVVVVKPPSQQWQAFFS